MSFPNLLNQTATINTQTPTVDDLGGRVEGTVTSTDVQCRIRMLSAHEREMSGAQGTDATHRMYCKPCTITEADTLTDEDGTEYEIEWVNRKPGGMANHHYEVDLRELRRQVT